METHGLTGLKNQKTAFRATVAAGKEVRKYHRNESQKGAPKSVNKFCSYFWLIPELGMGGPESAPWLNIKEIKQGFKLPPIN